MRPLEVSITCVALLERMVAGFPTGTALCSTHPQSHGELAGLEGGVGFRLPSPDGSTSQLHPNLEENQAAGIDHQTQEALPVQDTLGPGKSTWWEQAIRGGGAAPDGTPRVDDERHQPYSIRPAWLSTAMTFGSKTYAIKVPVSKLSPVKSMSRDRSILWEYMIGGKLEQPGELSKENHALEASLPQIWDRTIGHHGPVSDILRGEQLALIIGTAVGRMEEHGDDDN